MAGLYLVGCEDCVRLVCYWWAVAEDCMTVLYLVGFED